VPDDIYRVPSRSAGGRDRRSRRAAPVPASDCFHMPLFRPGTRVGYKGSLCTVSHVVLSHGELLVYLHETKGTVHADKLLLEPSRLSTRRV
jgi:hypothetical protein